LGVLAIPPLLFLASTIAFAAYYASQGASPEQISARTQAAASWILLVVQVGLLGLVLWLGRSGGAVGRPSVGRARLPLTIAIGAACGLGLGLAYVFALAPGLASLQRGLGDYVPAGSVLPTVGRSLGPFFVADVLLAPFLEEALYRGWAARRLLERFGVAPTTLIVCVAFGLFHWAGGFWYMLLVGFVAGGVFMTLRLRLRSLAAPIAAHFALNAVEFVSVFLAR
jgi:membrane protease YdiL (CAAX protease family)